MQARRSPGKKLGIIGLGAIGVKVANAAVGLDMEVWGYDPFLSVDGALKLDRSVKHVTDLNEIFANCDYITIHVPLNADTKNTISAEAIEKMKDGVRVINLARGELVDTKAMAKALESGKVAAYVSDFASDEILEQGECHHAAAPRRFHPGERGQLREDGRLRDHRVS